MEYQVAFNALKEIFILAPILGHWNSELLVLLETNASDHVLAAILSTHSREEVHLLIFYSRIFSPAKSNYDMYNKELLAIVEVFKKWYYYLEGIVAPVEVYINHKNLTYFSETKFLLQC